MNSLISFNKNYKGKINEGSGKKNQQKTTQVQNFNFISFALSTAASSAGIQSNAKIPLMFKNVFQSICEGNGLRFFCKKKHCIHSHH